VEAHDRKRLEQLCRYITRPALSDERVQFNVVGYTESASRRCGALEPRTCPLARWSSRDGWPLSCQGRG